MIVFTDVIIITYSKLYSVYDRTLGEWEQIITNNIGKIKDKILYVVSLYGGINCREGYGRLGQR